MGWDLSGLVAGIAVPVTVISAMRFMRRYFPTSPPKKVEAIADEDLGGAEKAVNAAMVVVGTLSGYGTYRLLLFANESFAHADGPAVFQLLPTKWLWFFSPFFGALCVSWDITLWLWSLVDDRGQIQRFLARSDARVGFNSTRALRWLALLICVPISILTLLALPMHSSIGEDGITVRSYASLSSKHYDYSRARRLAWVDGSRKRDGTLTVGANILIDFDDGYRWSSLTNRDFNALPDSGLVDFLHAKTGLPVMRAQTERDLPTLVH